MYKKIKFDNYLLVNLVYFFLFLIITVYGFLHIYSSEVFSLYSYGELFINYQAGFIRRGLLGEIFWQINEIFNLDPRFFFGYLFLFLNFLQFYFYYKILKNKKFNYIISLLIILSPTYILFGIYDYKVYFLKDIFVKISILLHTYIILSLKIKKKSSEYPSFLIRFIIPILIINTLIHEYQLFFILIHLLLSLTILKSSDKNFLKLYYLFIPLLLLLFVYSGNKIQYDYLNNIFNIYDIKIHPQLYGGLYKAIGGFYKWHFFYFTYRDFINLVFSFFLTIIVPFSLFHYFEKDNLGKSFKYVLFFIPSFLCFLLALDHGRNLSLLSVHLISYYLIFNYDAKKNNKIKKIIKQNVFLVPLIGLFIFFYLFLWKLDQYAGFGGRDQVNTIFTSSLFSEIIKLINFSYNFIDNNIINLPEIKL